VYPTYETRGDLGECVERFRDWLLEKVIDLEVAAGTPSPTIDPSVRTILVGHSMGGIVAAETAIALTSDHPIHGTTDPANDAANGAAGPPPRPATPNSLMFPYVQGVLAFDTPFLGISPGVVAHGAEGHYVTATTAMSQLSGLAGLWGVGAGAAAKAAGGSSAAAKGALPAPPPSAGKGGKGGKDEEAGTSAWGRWGKIAMAAGAVGAVAAGGAAAYMNREQITEGWSWASSHLEFIGCLGRKEELRRRVAYMVRLKQDVGVGFGNLYTRLGKAASSRPTVGVVGTVLGNERTFCVVPRKEETGEWKAAVNDVATDETWAHMCKADHSRLRPASGFRYANPLIAMFTPKDNPAYEKLANDATQMIVRWVQKDWYESSGRAAIEG